MIKLYINNVEYPVEDGVILNEKYNEELDSAIVTIPQVDRLNLSPFDYVRLEINNENHYFLINTWSDETVSFDPLKYTYTVSLISETIKLQKIVCPNLAITQPIGLTPRTIADKLEQYYEIYIQPQYPELTLSQDLLDLCDTICPENMFARPTMYEVFNTLLTKVNAVVKITNHVIGYLKLDEYGQEIDQRKLYYENETQNINEYANRLDINIDNGISQQANHVSIDGITPRTSASPVITDDNMEIILDKPIYEIEKVCVYYEIDVYYDGSTQSEVLCSDITSHIVEKNVYDYYLASNSPNYITDLGYKRNALYYQQGDNKIMGLGYHDSTYIVGASSMVAISNIINNVKYVPDGAIGVGEFPSNYIRGYISFRVEYKTSDSFRINIIKENTYNATLIDNQNEKQIDTTNFGKVEQDKLNRIGNREKIITATYSKEDDENIVRNVTDGNNTVKVVNNQFEFIHETSPGHYVGRVYTLIYQDGVVVSAIWNETVLTVSNNQFTDGTYTYTLLYSKAIPELGDYIDEYVLAQRELVKYDEYTLFKGYLYKDYIRKNLFYGLNSKKRFTQISGEFVNRDEIENYSISFSSSEPSNLIKYRYLITMILLPVSGGYIEDKPHHALFTFFDKNEDALIASKYIIKNVSYYDCGRVNTFVVRMDDNYSAGKRASGLVTIPLINTETGIIQKEVKYTDDYGEFVSYGVSIYASVDDDFMGKTLDMSVINPIANDFPLIAPGDFGTYIAPYSYSLLSENKNIYKDNREVFGYVANFNYVDTDEVIIGNLSSLSGLIIDYAQEFSNFHFCYSKTERYERGATKGLGQHANMSISSTNADGWEDNHTPFNSIQFVSHMGATTSWTSYGLLDENYNLILGVNRVGNSSIAMTIYLHFNKENY